MLEIVVLVLLWKLNGRIVREKGLPTKKYHILTIVLWFAFEFVGIGAGLMITESFFSAVYFGLLGASLGGYLSYRIAKNAQPAEDFNGNVTEKQSFWKMQPHRSVELLSAPSTVRIFVDPSETMGNRPELFFLNCQPLCNLLPGNGYTFRTMHKKNQVTIGLPQYPNETPENTIRFICSENGYVEIHVSEGKIARDRFVNYTE